MKADTVKFALGKIAKFKPVQNVARTPSNVKTLQKLSQIVF